MPEDGDDRPRRGRHPSRVGEYRIEGQLGVGAHGVVYAARDQAGAAVALKVLTSDKPSLVRRFEREGGLRFAHPNVVRVLDAGRTDEGAFFIALERLEGTSLSERLAGGRTLAVPEALDLAEQLCAGLSAAHARGVVHRDLKPSNVFVCADGTVKILDFGIARADEPGPSLDLTMEGMVLGTPGYLSPEQARGEIDVDERADLWSVGILLYQCLCGRNPFRRETAPATIVAVVIEEPPPIAELVPRLPDGLPDIVHRCLAKDRVVRFSTADELARALRALDPDRPAEPKPVVSTDERRFVAVLLARGVRDEDALRRCVERWGGGLSPMIGDRAIAVFGGERLEGDECERALHAALESRGVVAGSAIAVGRAAAREGRVAGEAVRAVEQASRVDADGVVVDAGAARRLAGVSCRPVEDGFFVVDLDAPRLPSEAPGTRSGEGLLVGRELELAQITALADRAFDDRRATVIAIEGPPGIGKTRLLRAAEAALRTRATAPRIACAAGASYRRGARMFLVAQLVRSLAIAEAKPGTGRLAAIAALVTRHVQPAGLARECAAGVLQILGLAAPEPTVTGSLDPRLLEDRLRAGLGDLVVSVATRGPLVLSIDDAQWADDGSIGALDAWLARAASLPILVLSAGRAEPDERAPLFDGHDRREVSPRPLSRADVAELTARLTGAPPSSSLVEAMLARTGGNPMFVEQIVRELLEHGRIADSTDALPTPVDVEAAVQMRLDHLPRDEKRVCLTAAVVGGSFSASTLRGLGLTGAEAALRSLSRRRLLARDDAEGGARRYRFASEVFSEVAYSMNRPEALERLHALAAETLAAEGADPADVARHHELAGQDDRAAGAWVHAAEQYGARGDGHGVLHATDRAVVLGVPTEHRFELHALRAEALCRLGTMEDARRELMEAERAARTPADVARVLQELAALLATVGEHDAAIEAADRGVRAARASGDPDLLTRALVRQAWPMLYAGRTDEAEALLREAAALAPRARVASAAYVSSWMSQLHGMRGDLSGRQRECEVASALYREASQLRGAAQADSNLADVLNRLGAFAEAEEALEGAVETSRRVHNPISELYALLNLGYARAGLGRAADALEALDRATELARAHGDRRAEVMAATYRLRARRLHGDPRAVAAEATEAASEADAAGMPAVQVGALAMTADAWLSAAEPATALTYSQRAMDLLARIGAIEEDEIEVYVTHARTLAALGREDDAAQTVRRGLARLDELASRISEAELRQRFLTDVPAHRALQVLAAAQ